MKKLITSLILLSGYVQAVTLDKELGEYSNQALDEIHNVTSTKEGLEKNVSSGDCYNPQEQVPDTPTEWSSFLKLSLIETGTKNFSDYFSNKDIKKLDCGQAIELEPSLKIWGDRAAVNQMIYNCPRDDKDGGAGPLPSVILQTTIDSKNCFMSFTPDILNEIFRSKEQVRFSETSLSNYATNISCVGEDQKIELVVFGRDDNKNLKVIKDQRFNIKDIDVVNPYYDFGLTGLSVGTNLNLNGPYVGAALSATIVGNIMSFYGGAPVTLDHLMSSMMLSDTSKENVRQYMKDKNIVGSSNLYFSVSQIGGTNYLLENTDYSFDEFTRQLSSVGISNVVGTSIGENGDLTLQLNTSVGQSGGVVARASGHYRVNDDIDIYTTYGVDSSIKATYDIGDSMGVTLGGQLTSLGGAGVCAGYFNQKKNGIKSKKGVCVNQNGGEYYSQEACPELFGTSCSMSVTSIIPSLGFIDIKNIRMLRPGEYYRLEGGNLVGLRKMQDENGEDYYHFQLYQYPESVNELRTEITQKEDQVRRITPVSYVNLNIQSTKKAKEFNDWLDGSLLPFLKDSGKKITGVRYDLSSSRKDKNELTSDGVLIIRKFSDPLEDVVETDVDFSLKRKNQSGDEIDPELVNILNILRKEGVLIDLDLSVLTADEQKGLNQYLKFLTANFGYDGLKGRRLIFTEDPSNFLGFGEDPYNFSGTDIKISIGLLENLTKLDFTQKVPADMVPRKPSECKKLQDANRQRCMQDAFLSVVYSQNFQIGGRKVEFLDRSDMRKLVPSRFGSGPKARKPTPFSKVVDDKVYIIADADRIESYLEPGIFHSPVESIKGLMIPSDLESSVDLLRETATKSAFTYEQNQKDHTAKMASDDAELFNFKNRGNDQYHFMTVYEDDVQMNYKGKALASCVEVRDSVATVYYAADNLECGDYSSDNAKVASSIDLKDPDTDSDAYTDIFQKYIPTLFQVRELK